MQKRLSEFVSHLFHYDALWTKRCLVYKSPNPLLLCVRTFSDEDGDVDMRAEASVNQIQLLGRIGKDPEERGTYGNSLVLFPLATNSSYNRHDGTRVSRTEWHRICVGLPTLKEKVALNLRKGDRVFLSGEVRYDEYADPATQAKVRATSIFANFIVNLTKKYRSEPELEHE